MKAFLAVCVVTLSGIGWSAEIDLTKPIPVIRLSDGRVLKNVTFAKFGPETVLLRSQLGPLGVRYEALPDDVRAAAEPHRAGGARWFAGDTSGNTETIEGQVFIQTVGDSSYKFGNVEVYAFDLPVLSNFDGPKGGKVYLGRPIHEVTTDADGKFILKVPMDRPYFIFVQASRLVDANNVARYEWRAPMSAVRKGRMLLLSSDYRFPASRVEIEKVE